MITNEQYFDLNNKCLTRSKLMDYQRSPEYFFKLHVSGQIKRDYKDAFKTGSTVDDLLAQIDNKGKYMVCKFDGRTKEGKAERAEAEAKFLTILSPQDYEEVIGLADAVEKTTAYKQLAGFERQKLLQCAVALGEHFDTLAALPDFIKIENRHADIVDLKTAATINPRRYYYHAEDYGYKLQFALQIIILKSLDLIDTFTCKHLVVEKQKNIWNTAVFQFDNSEIEEEARHALSIMNALKNDKHFAKTDASLTSPILINNL